MPDLTTSRLSLPCSGVRLPQPLRTEGHPSPIQLTVPLQLTCSGGTPWEPASPGPLRSSAFSGEDPATPTAPPPPRWPWGSCPTTAAPGQPSGLLSPRQHWGQAECAPCWPLAIPVSPLPAGRFHRHE